MKFDVAAYLPFDFHRLSRVWIYQSSRPFTVAESQDLVPMLKQFAGSWLTHGTPVKGFADLLFERFIVIMADETAAGVSGCSTDSSVRLIKQIEEKFQVDLFNRQNLAFIINDQVQTLPLAQLNHGLENNIITEDTIYFNNLVATKAQLLNEWMIPIKASWLSAKIRKVSIG